MALFGVKQWLDEWAPDLTVDDSESRFELASDVLEAVCSLQVGRFNLYLVATTLLMPTINLPRVVNLPQLVPPIYVLVEVREEPMQVQLYGYLRHEQLVEQRQSHSPATVSGLTYAVPLNWFHADPTALLLELRCLTPIAPSSANAQTSALPPMPATVQPLNQQAINVGYWLSDRLSEVARQLHWILVPSFASASALRSARDELETLGVHIPPEARGAYQDLRLGDAALRLYAFTWVLSSTLETFGWTLLIILGAQPNTRLPTGIRLQVRDETQSLFEQVLPGDSEESYLYAQVGGGLSDRFWVAIDIPDGAMFSLPPFSFNPAIENEQR